MARSYHFRTTWLVDQAPEPLWDTLEDLLEQSDPMPWWHAVTVTGHRGDEFDLEARSAFGYRLRFTVHDLELDRPRSMRLRSRGDLEGNAVLDFSPGPDDLTRLDITWQVAATPRWMQRTDVILRPVFVLAHGLIMKTGERRLNRWLAARG